MEYVQLLFYSAVNGKKFKFSADHKTSLD